MVLICVGIFGFEAYVFAKFVNQQSITKQSITKQSITKQSITKHQRMFEMVVGLLLVFAVMGFIYLRFYETIRIGFLIIINLVAFTRTNFNFTR